MGKIIQGTQSVSRAIGIMKIIASYTQKNGARLVDIAQELNLEPPTVHRLLKLLTQEGVLIKKTNRYLPGPLIFELGLASVYDSNIIELCTPILRQLSQKTADTSFLFIHRENDAVCLAREQGSHPIKTPVVPVGCRQPLGVSAGGLALLAALELSEIENILQTNAAKLITYGGLTIEQMRQMHKRSQEQGYSDIANTAVPGIRGIGMAIMDSHNRPVAAIAIATTITRMTDTRIGELLPYLLDATHKIKEALRRYPESPG